MPSHGAMMCKYSIGQNLALGAFSSLKLNIHECKWRWNKWTFKTQMMKNMATVKWCILTTNFFVWNVLMDYEPLAITDFKP